MKNLLAFIFIFLSTGLVAQTWGTLRTGAGGWITGMHIHPTGDPVLAKSDVGGAYKYDSSTNSWEQLVDANSIPASDIDWQRYEGVTSIVSAPSNNQKLYMAFFDKIYYSDDQGANWIGTSYIETKDIEVTDGQDTFFYEEFQPNSDEGKLAGERLAVDPINEDVVYFGSSFLGLQRTENGGTDWESIDTSIVPSGSPINGIRTIVFDSTFGSTNGKTNRIYVFPDSEDVYMSNDAGVTWTSLNFPIADVNYFDVEVADGKLSLVGRDLNNFFGGFGMWEYDGTDWNHKYDVNDGEDYLDLAIDPFDPDRAFLFAELSSVIQRTTNLSAPNPTWETLTNDRIADNIPWMAWTETNAYTIGEILFDPIENNKLWISMGTGVYTSDDLDDNVMSWEENSLGQEHLVSNDAISFPDNSVLTSHWDFGIFKHLDYDAYPVRHYPSSRFSSAWDLEQSPSNPNFVAAVITDGRPCCFDNESRNSGYTEDGGLTWTKFGSLPGDDPIFDKIYGQLAISANDNDNMVWMPVDSRLPYYTMDRGDTWTQAIIPDASPDCCIYASFFEALPLTADKVASNTFYFYDQGDEGAIFKSEDGGVTWVKISTELDVFTFNAKLEAVHNKEGQLFWAGGAQDAKNLMSGLWFSNDGGESFSEIPGTDEVISFSIGKNYPEETYPAVYFYGKYNSVEGYYVSKDSLQTWENIGTFAGNKYDRPVVFEADKFQAGRLFVGFSGEGFMYYEDNTITNTVNILAGDQFIEIFPNPTNGVFNVSGNLQNYTIQVLDNTGNVFQTLPNSYYSTEVDLSTLPSGLYFILVKNSSNENVAVERIIKE